MKLKMLMLLAFASVLLVACEETEEREILMEKGLMFSEKPLEFVGYLDLESRLYPDNTIRYEVQEDTNTGCHYLYEPVSEMLTPYIDIDGTVYGCKEEISKSDGDKAYSKKDYLKVLSEYYPYTDDSELEYMLENVFSYGSITFTEFKDKVEYLNKTDEKDKTTNKKDDSKE